MRPYLRHSRMRFLQHFLPGQPLEENGQTSAGILTMGQLQREHFRLTVGADVDLSDTWLREIQEAPTEGPPFLVATRPAGRHYDYTVAGVNVAAYVQGEWMLGEAFELTAGVRAESMHYDYDNLMLDGNTKDNGEPCDFGGCLYTRPADRNDRFTDLAPHLALDWTVNTTTNAYLRFAHGFRAPQTTELYRLQSGQQVADLESETVDSAEAGLRFRSDAWLVDSSLFAMQKDESVLRDAEGFNVSGGSQPAHGHRTQRRRSAASRPAYRDRRELCATRLRFRPGRGTGRDLRRGTRGRHGAALARLDRGLLHAGARACSGVAMDDDRRLLPRCGKRARIPRPRLVECTSDARTGTWLGPDCETR